MAIQQIKEKLNRHQHYLNQDPNNANLMLTVRLLKAQLLHHEQNLDEAITLLETLRIDYPMNADVIGLLALIYFDNNQLEQAEQFAKAALSIEPNQYEGLLVQMLLRALEQNTTPDEINTLIQRNPQDSRLWFALGAAELRLINIPKALDAFFHATTIWPDFYDSWIYAGWCQLLQNQLAEAKLSFEKALNISEQEAEAWGGLALISALNNHQSDAKKELEKCLARDPTCFLATMTQMILANPSNVDETIKQFKILFPDMEQEITLLLNSTLSLNTNNHVVH